MTPERIEEAFKKWLQDNYMVETEWGNPEKTIPRMAWKAAWLEATRQAYEASARICDDVCNDSMHAADAAERIRAKLKELDNGN